MASMTSTLSGIAQRPQASNRPAAMPTVTITIASSSGLPIARAVASEEINAQAQASGNIRALAAKGDGVSPRLTQSAPEAAAMPSAKPANQPTASATAKTPTATATPFRM